MGGPAALNLIKGGHKLIVCDLDPARAAPHLERGATWTETPMNAARDTEIVFTMVFAPRQIEQAVRGENGILPVLTPGQIWVGMTANQPALARAIAEQIHATGAQAIDALVSGAVDGARTGNMPQFASGDAGTIARIRPVMELVGPPYCMGANGRGSVTKPACNQSWAIHAAAMGEALVMAVKSGVDLSRDWDALKIEVNDSWCMHHDAPSVFCGTLRPVLFAGPVPERPAANLSSRVPATCGVLKSSIQKNGFAPSQCVPECVNGRAESSLHTGNLMQFPADWWILRHDELNIAVMGSDRALRQDSYAKTRIHESQQSGGVASLQFGKAKGLRHRRMLDQMAKWVCDQLVAFQHAPGQGLAGARGLCNDAGRRTRNAQIIFENGRSICCARCRGNNRDVGQVVHDATPCFLRVDITDFEPHVRSLGTKPGNHLGKNRENRRWGCHYANSACQGGSVAADSVNAASKGISRAVAFVKHMPTQRCEAVFAIRFKKRRAYFVFQLGQHHGDGGWSSPQNITGSGEAAFFCDSAKHAQHFISDQRFSPPEMVLEYSGLAEV